MSLTRSSRMPCANEILSDSQMRELNRLLKSCRVRPGYVISVVVDDALLFVFSCKEIFEKISVGANLAVVEIEA